MNDPINTTSEQTKDRRVLRVNKRVLRVNKRVLRKNEWLLRVGEEYYE